MREQSYLGWIIYLLQPISKKSIRKINFKEWLNNFGLLDEKERHEKIEDIEKMKKKSLK